MSVCLITAPTAAEFGDDDELKSNLVRQITLEPQLGILSLAAVLEARGDSVQIVDLNRTYFQLADSVAMLQSWISSQKPLPERLPRGALTSTDLVRSAVVIL